MSSTSTPITPARFSEAISELPLSSLFAKAAELRNSIAHLERSNDELVIEANGGDGDCADAIVENMAVVTRMQERLDLLKLETEGRGYIWNKNQGEESNHDTPVSEYSRRYEGDSQADSLPDVSRRAQARGPLGSAYVAAPSIYAESDPLVSERIQENADPGVHL